MTVKTTNPLSRYFGEMEKKPLRKGELKQIFEQLATRPVTDKHEPTKGHNENTTTKKPTVAH